MAEYMFLSRAMSAPREAGERPRCSLGPKDLADLLAPAIEKGGRCFLKYDEAKLTAHAKSDPEVIAKSGDLLLALHKAHPSLAFAKSLIRAALKELVSRWSDRADWAIKGDDEDDYLDTMSCRIANIARHVAQGQLKPKPAAWVATLPWNVKESAADPPASSGSSRSYAYGFDKEMKVAWRCLLDPGKGSKKELSCKIKESDGVLIASWSDGHTWNISDISVADYKELVGSGTDSGKPSSNVFYDSEHEITQPCASEVQKRPMPERIDDHPRADQPDRADFRAGLPRGHPAGRRLREDGGCRVL